MFSGDKHNRNTPPKILAASLFVCLFLFTYKVLTYKDSHSKSLEVQRKVSVSTYDIIIVTRIHGKSTSVLPSPEEVITRVSSFLEYGGHVLICLDIGESFQNEIYVLRIKQILTNSSLSSQIELVIVSPWGRFVSALNSAVIIAKDLRYKFVCFQSLELSVTASAAHSIIALIESDTLVVGYCFKLCWHARIYQCL